MKSYSYSQARTHLARLLDEAKTEPVVIRRRRGDAFLIVPQSLPGSSPFDVPGLSTGVTRAEIVAAVRESRASPAGKRRGKRR